MENTWNQGDLVKCLGTFTDPDTGLPSTPAGPVHFVCKKPDGTYLRYTQGVDVQLLNPSANIVRVDVDTSAQSGDYTYCFYAPPGAGQTSAERVFHVNLQIR